MRRYSNRMNPNDFSKLKGYAMTGYLCAAFALPFVPPYLASKRTQQDGSWKTRSAITGNPHEGQLKLTMFRPPLKLQFKPCC